MYFGVYVDHFCPCGMRGDVDETCLGLPESAHQQRVAVIGIIAMARVEIVTRDAVVDVCRRYIQRGILHPAHLRILDNDGHVTREVGEYASQLLNVHGSASV